MSLTKIGSIGVSTGIQFAGVTTVATLHVGSGVTLSSDGDIFATGISTFSEDIKVGSGITLSPDGNIFATGVTTATTFVGALTGNVTGNISGGTVAGSTGTFSGAVSGTTGTFSGAVSGTTGTFSGDISVNGGDVSVTGGEGTSAALQLIADQGDDNGDGWEIRSNQDDNDLTIKNNTSGSYVDKFTLLKTGELTLTSDLTIPDKIIHTGDTNTAIRFPAADTITAETGGSERARLGSSGEVYFGTSNWPTGSLGKAASRVMMGNEGSLTIWNETNSAGGGGTLKLACKEGSDATRIGFVNLVGGTENTSDRASFFKIQVANSSGSGLERLRITSAGNIGINESAPSEKLQIDGDILLGGQANSGTADYAIKFEYNNHQFAKIVGDGRDSSGYGDIDFYTSTGSGVSNLTQRMTIRANGYVAIGEPSPSALLHLSTPASTACEIRLQSNNTGSGSGDRGRINVYSALNNGTAYQAGYVDIDRSSGTDDIAHLLVALNDGSSVAERLRITGSGDLQFNSGFGSVQTAYGCRVWVIIDNTSGNMSLLGGGNVSSVGDNGTGSGQVYFSNAMTNTSYCVVSGLRRSGTHDMLNVNFSNSTGNFRFDSFSNASSGNADLQGYAFAVFR